MSANHVLYDLVEPTFGIIKRSEVGAHIQEAVRPAGPDWGGARLRSMVILPTPDTFPVKFGVNVESGYTPPACNPATWDMEISVSVRRIAFLRS